jgi:hypothetical protein
MTVERKHQRPDVDENRISHGGPDDPIPRTGIPIFYFDNIDAVCSSFDGNNSSSSSSPLASDPPTVGVVTADNVPYNIFSAAHGVNILPHTPSNFCCGHVPDED